MMLQITMIRLFGSFQLRLIFEPPIFTLQLLDTENFINPCRIYVDIGISLMSFPYPIESIINLDCIHSFKWPSLPIIPYKGTVMLLCSTRDKRLLTLIAISQSSLFSRSNSFPPLQISPCFLCSTIFSI